MAATTASVADQKMNPEQYLVFERAAECKHEYWHGEVFAMVGASREHNLLVGNLVYLLNTALLDRPCEVYPSDMRVGAATGDVFTYPDVSVVCGEPNLTDQANDTLLNPLVVVEVLSHSTEAYDRGKKFEHYRKIASVQHYLLVTQTEPLVELYTRQADGTWSLSDRRMGDAVVLSALGCELAVAEIYRRVFELG
jgi:Uma2 family endonuclease